MTFLGVPIFEWVLLVVVLGFGVEAWITCRDKGEDAKAKSDTENVQATTPLTHGSTPSGIPPKES